MKKIFFFLAVLFSFAASAQVYQVMPQYGYQFPRVDAQFVLKIPSDTTNNKTGIARIGTTLYSGNGTYWTAAAGSGGSTDTTSLSNRINAKVNISDTATMLSKYLRKTDTASLSSRIDLKLNISDTSGKWLGSIYRSHDSVFTVKGSTATFAYKDSVGSGGGGTPTGWDDMLAQGQAQTTGRDIELANQDLNIWLNGSATDGAIRMAGSPKTIKMEGSLGGQSIGILGDSVNIEVATSNDTSIYKPLVSSDGFGVARLGHWPVGTGGGGSGGTDSAAIHLPDGITSPSTYVLKFSNLQGDTTTVTIDTTGMASNPAGNEGNIQINRGGVFSTPASDSLTFSSGVLNVLGDITGDRSLTIGALGAPVLQIPSSVGGAWGIGDVASVSNGTRIIGYDNTETVEITAHNGVTVIGKLTADSLDVLGNFRLAGTQVSSTATQLNYLSTATGVTGSGNNVLGTSPTFTTDLTSPKIIGGTGTTSTLTLQSTSGVGTTNADIIFKVGNNGATEGMRIANSGAITLGGALSSVYNGSFNNMTLSAGLTIPKTITAGGTTGAQTINKISGSVNFAAGASTLVVTNSLVSSTSLVIVQVYGTDVTATSARVTLASGSFTITLNAAATAETKVGFLVTN